MEFRDANGTCFPLVSAICPVESSDNYEWFLNNVCKYEGMREFLDCNMHQFMSDRDKGLAATLKKLFPKAWARKCFKHIERNLQGNPQVRKQAP